MYCANGRFAPGAGPVKLLGFLHCSDSGNLSWHHDVYTKDSVNERHMCNFGRLFHLLEHRHRSLYLHMRNCHSIKTPNLRNTCPHHNQNRVTSVSTVQLQSSSAAVTRHTELTEKRVRRRHTVKRGCRLSCSLCCTGDSAPTVFAMIRQARREQWSELFLQLVNCIDEVSIAPSGKLAPVPVRQQNTSTPGTGNRIRGTPSSSVLSTGGSYLPLPHTSTSTILSMYWTCYVRPARFPILSEPQAPVFASQGPFTTCSTVRC